MNAEDSLKLARRFIGLPLEKRQMFLAALHKEGVDFARFPIPQGVEADDRQALSYAQQRMWFLWQLDPHSGAYNLPGAVRLTGRLSLAALDAAFASLVARHETLRTVFQRQADDSLLQVPADAPLVIEHVDFSGLAAPEREVAVADAAQQQSLQPFDLAVGPLLRVKLLKLDEQEHVLLLTLHHIVSDGWSMNVLIDEFIRCYDAHEAGQSPQLTPLPIQYSDYALWQRRWLEAGEQARQLEYWQAQLGNEHPVLELPTDHPRPAMPSYRGTRYEFTIDGALAEQLRSSAQQHNITLFMLLLGAFNVLLHRYTGQSDIRVGVPIANRNRGEIEGLIGFFVNTQVLRTELDGQTRVGDLLRAVKETALGAQAHQDLPFERLVEALKLERSLSHTPLFQVMYNHQPQVADISTVSTASGLELGVIEWQGRTTQFDLTLDTYEKGGRLHAALTYANDLFDPQTITRMAQHWLNLLCGMVQNSNQRISDLPLLEAAEYQRMVFDWNSMEAGTAEASSIHRLIEQQAAAQPDALAVTFGEQAFTYAEIDARANALAHKLIECGVGPEVRVGVAMQRSDSLLVALLAVLKAGGAYVPLDPDYPADRVAYMLEDSRALVLLTEHDVAATLSVSAETQVLLLDRIAAELAAYPSSAPVTAVTPDNLAYVIYTSGSTGKPKGVAIAHRNVQALIDWSRTVYSRDDIQGVLASTSVCFDLSVWELFVTLANGGSVIIARNALELPQLPARDQVRLINTVPSAINALQRDGAIPSSVRIINLAGEPLKQSLVEALYQQAGVEHVYDLYGPSEDTTYSTWTRRAAGGTPSIGRPLTGTASFLLDADLQPVPQGAAAELYLAGAGITRGYLGRAAMTAEKYVPNPFTNNGERLYRTGDLTRYQADGALQYVGRIDYQVKVRGFRIELGEIEARLLQQEAVRELAVLAQEGASGQQLVAYIVPTDAAVLAADADAQASLRETLKAALRQHLPDYMVPAYLLFLEQLPLTPNGKLDRKALPAIDGSQQQREHVAPRSALEKALAAIWQDVLSIENVGLEDNFFELGGDSIVSMQVVSRARQAGIVLSPKELFQHQTIRSLAQVARQGQQTLIDQGPAVGAVALAPVQQWFFEQDIPQRQHWNQSLLLTAQQPVDAGALDRALSQLLNHHDALRLRYASTAEGWQQAYAAPTGESVLWQRNAQSLEDLKALCDEAQRSLDLSNGPLLRALLVNMADGGQRLLLVAHHLVIDGVSWRVLLEDLQAAYIQALSGAVGALPGKTSSYQQWVARLQGHLPTFAESLDYWQAQLRDAPRTELPCERPDGALENRFEHKVELKLSTEQTRKLLQQAPAAYRTQVNDLLLTALARVVCRWSGQASTLVQLEGHGREDLFDDIDLTRTLGWFTSLFPVNLRPADNLGASIKAIKEQLRAVPDKGLSYGALRYLADAQTAASLGSDVKPRITFNYLGQFDRQFDEAALFVPSGEGGGEAQDPSAPLANWLTVEGQVYGGELALNWGFSREMFDTATVQQLADQYALELNALIDHCCALDAPQATPSDFPLARVTQAQLDALPVPAGELDDLYPLSPMQQGLLFHTLYEQAAGEYINQMRVDVQGIDPQRFRDAWQATVDAQDILRSGFVWQGELAEPVQIVHKQVQLPFTALDWRSRDDQPQALAALADDERQQGFDLTCAPLLRLVLVQTGAEQWHLIYTHHHILMDGWSNSQLLGEVLQRYSGQIPVSAGGRYRDYIAWLQRQDAQLSENFWGEQLAALQEPTRLARVASTSDSQSGHGDHFQTLDVAHTQALETFARQQKVTVNTLIQAAWLLLLQRYTGHEAVAFGATVAGRPADLPGIEQQVGLFINTLPVIGAPRPDQSVGSWLQAVQGQNLSLRDFEHTPLADIQRWAGQGGEALFDNILVFENYPIAQALKQGVDQGVVFGEVANLEQTHYALSVAVTLGEQLALHYSFDRGHFAGAAIEGISAHLLQLLEQFAVSAERSLGEIALADAGEHARQLADNHPQPYPVDVAVHQRISTLAAERPQRTAVIFNGQHFSYGEIDQRANQLAHALIARGVGAETRVGVALPRSEAVIIALLAVLKAGGAYVPLDTSYPRERLAYLIEDSGLALLISDSSVSAQLPVAESVPVLELDRLDLREWPIKAPQVQLDPDNLAYVIYTSGSTGNPKGVSVAHGPLAMHCQAIGQRYEMRDSDCEFHFMSFAFDGAHERWLTSLTHGASLLIRDDTLWTPEQTYNAMREHGVTVVAFPPVYLQQLAEHAEREGNPPKVRIYCFGGDAVPSASFERVKRALDPDYIINGYGPTETVVTPLIWKAGREVPCGAAYAPIGSRIGDRSAYVLDADLNLLPQGMAGELYLGGTGLARGYLNRPGLTAERFVADPFSHTGGLLYRTGDLVRQRADGTFDYLDRIDNQVKIRGFRIELGEIEACLQALDGVREAVVVAQEGSAGSGKRLVAYVVGDSARKDFAEDLREQLKATLPTHMVPAYVLRLERMPLTPNGKLDRKNLPKPDVSQLQQAYVAPQTVLEQQLATIWQDVLKLQQVGVSDNFFELGGDSIISIQVVSRARQAAIRFTPKDLFQHQTIAALAAVAKVGEQTQAIDQGPVTGALPLLAVQQAFFEQDIPERQHWNQAVMLKPTQPLEAAALEQALDALVAHHDGLRLSFVEQADGWHAEYRGVDSRNDALLWSVDVADAASLEAVANEAQRSLDLQAGPLLRAVLANLDDGSQRLLLAIHHLVVDGVSWRILFDDLQSAYRQIAAGEPLRLPAKTSAARAWAEHLQTYARSSELRSELAYWQEQLQGADVALPLDNADGGLQNRHALTVRTRLDKAQTRQLLQDAPAAYRTQVNDLLLTALARVMVRWTGADSALIQLEGHGREELFDSIDLTRTVGWFTTVYPAKLTPVAELGASLKQIKEQLRAIPNKGIGFGALAYLGEDADRASLAQLPVPRLTFNYLGQFDGSFDAADGALFVPSSEAAGDELDANAPLANHLALNGQVYGGELNLGWTFSHEMFDEATIQRLADDYTQELQALIAHCCQADHHGVTPSDFPLARLSQAQLDGLPLAPQLIEDVYPLSPMQQGMLFHAVYEESTGNYINQMRLDVEGLDPERFHQAWQAAVDAHDILRTRFVWQGELDAPVQVVSKHAQMPYSLHDWRAQPHLEDALQTLADAERQSLDLNASTLLRLVIVRIDDQRHHLIYTNHHILMDGWSNSQLLGEVLQRYSGKFSAAHAGRYGDYIGWLQRQDAAASEAFWLPALRTLDEPTRLAHAIARPKDAPAVQGYGDHYRVLDSEQSARLGEFARASKVTVNTLVQAAWLLVLQRYTGKASVAFGATVAGRPADLPGIEQQIGLFINTLPVIASPRPEQSLGSWLQAVQAQNLALREFEHTALFDIQRWAGQGGEALFDNILVFENYPIAQALEQGAPQGLRFGPVANHEQTNYPLTLGVSLEGTLEVHYSFDRLHFADATVEQLGAQLNHVLMQMAGGSDQRCLGDLQLLDAAARELALNDWGYCAGHYPTALHVHQLFEQQVQRAPDQVALYFADQRLTYAELNQQANRLAHTLRQRGVGPDVLVGIAVERSLEMIISLLAVLKAGGAYVPLDPQYPGDRLTCMIEDSGLLLLLSQSHLLERLPQVAGVEVLCVERLPEQLESADLPNLTLADNLAYVMFTSGSTGRPKGVGINQASLTKHAYVTVDLMALTAQDCVLQFSTFNFDGFVEQLYPALITGASVVLRGTEIWDSETLYREMLDKRISVIDLTTAYWGMLAKDFAEVGPRDYGVLRQVHAGGEAMPPEGMAAWNKAGLAHVRLLNTYGPTEATVTATSLDCGDYVTGVEPTPSTLPIGSALPGRSIYLLDIAGQPVPVGAVGELMIGGELLARGYFNRPDLSAERFMPDPFSVQPGARLYRTGDLARFRADGVIEYIGRVDHQVKIRGFRIELGEIEARLLDAQTVRETLVMAVAGPSGQQLVAYVVPTDAEPVMANSDLQSELRRALREQLQQTLPDYMVPTHLLFLAKMPLSPNGKLDRHALSKPDAAQAQQDYLAATNATEQTLVDIWQAVLGLAQVGVTDNFFELGGDSIVSIQVVSRARQAGIHFSPKDLFQHQTIQGLASVAQVGEGGFVIDQSPVTGASLLLPAQLQFFEEGVAEPHHWNQSVLLNTSQTLEAGHLKAALGALIEHHDALRLSFASVDGQWVAQHQEVGEQPEDLLWQAQVANAAELEALGLEAQRSLVLGGPLLRAVLATLADGTQRLLLVIHHLVVDGVSWRVLLEDLQGLYQQISSAQPVKLPARTSAFKTWAERLHAYANSEVLLAEQPYWFEQLQNVSSQLPVDHAEGSLQSRYEHTVQTRLGAELTRQLLQDAPAAYRTQVNDLLLTALARVISRWTGEDSTLIQLEGHGREDLFADIDLSRSVGWFTSLFPVKLTAGAELGASLKAVKEQLRAIPNKGIGFGVLRYLGSDAVRETLRALPQPAITFNYLGQFDSSFDAGQATLFTPSSEARGAEQSLDALLSSPLTLNGGIYGGEFSLGWTFSERMFERGTVQALADDYAQELTALIEHCCRDGVHGVTPSDFPLAPLSQAQLDGLPLPASLIEDIYPLSPMQQGMLFHTLYEEEAGDYINQTRADVQGLDVERFRASWQAALQAHDVLRSGFLWQGERPVQVVHKQVELPFSVQDWRGRRDYQADLDALAAQERKHGFELTAAPLLRLCLVRIDDDTYHLIYTNHHILMDGWGNSQLMGEVLHRYSGLPLAQSVGRYRDYIAWLQRQDGSVSESFWKTQLADLQEPTRLTQAIARRDDLMDVAGYADHQRVLNAAATRQLAEFAREQKVTLNTLVQAAWLLLLQRYSGQDTVAFGATVAGRPADLKGIEQQIGLFINTLPVIGTPRAEQSVGQWLHTVQTQNLSLREHEHTPLFEIQRWAGKGGDALFDSILVFENYPVSEAMQQGAPAGLRFTDVTNHEQTNYPLTLAVSMGDTLSLHFSYGRAYFAEVDIARLGEHLHNLLTQMMQGGALALGQLELLSGEEHQQQVEQWNATATEYPLSRSVHSLIEDQVRATPDALALVFGEQRLTYAQLNARANQLAAVLIEHGVGPEVLVGISVERSLEMVVSLLAILKAGGAYLPLDPEYPQDRLAYMFEDSGIALLLTQSHLLAQLPVPAGLRSLVLDQDGDWLEGRSEANPELNIDPENLAYVIYTSGSTGKPKGAGNRHSALVNRLCWMQQAYQLTAEDSVLQKTPFSFDVSVWEFFWPLMTGSSLVVAAPGAHRDPAQLIQVITEQRITTLHFVPSMLQAFLQDPAVAECTSLTRIVCSGEALQVDAQQQVFAKLPNAGLFNLYGPTEAAIDVTHWTCRDEGRDSVPIGQPIANLSTYILDNSLAPLPVGVIGELYLGGEGLARGYHRRPALTAERFVTSPFGDGQRLYRTGDLARYRADGVIEYAGRMDHQVKIRGLRIELGEIEARLAEHDDVRETVVIAQDGSLLVGYVVPNDESLLEADEDRRQAFQRRLKEHLSQNLPEYMIPQHWLLLAKMPVSPNGKLERKALPKADLSVSQKAYSAPTSEIEQALAAIWQNVLGLEQVGIHDNFFELGGDSIISIQVVSRARQAGIHFSPKDLFLHQNVQSLAAVAKVGMAGPSIDQGPVVGDSPLLPFQQLFFDSAMAEPHHWNQSVLLKPRETLDAAHVEQALQALLVQHDALRMAFSQRDGQWSATHRAPGAEPLLWQHAVADDAALEQLGEQAQRSLDLANGPLLRALLATLADGSQRLLLVIHHLAVDGVSWRILLEDLQQAYQQLQAGQALKLPAKTSAAKTWAQRLQTYAASPALQAELSFWQAQLQGAKVELPLDHADGALQNRYAASVETRLDKEQTRQLLQQAPAAYRTQVNDLLLTALARVISRWTASESTLIQLEGHGREDLFDELDLSRTVGWFTSLFPVRLTPTADLAGSIKAIKEQLREIPAKGIGFGALRYLGDDAARQTLQALPMPRITFNYLGQFDAGFAEDGGALFSPANEPAGAEQSPLATLGNWLTLNGQVYGGELSVGWTFSSQMFDIATIQTLADAYAQELKALLEHCCQSDSHGVTPSDFPLAHLTQQQLDSLALAPQQIEDIYPLSPMQQGMLFHTLYEQQAGDYINQMCVDVQGLDIERFRAAWQDALDAHDVLRSSFVWDGEFQRPVQVIHKHLTVPFSVLDWRERADLQQAIAALALAEQQQGFELGAAPLLRLRVVRTAADACRLIYTSHHILMDGWSNSQLLGEVLQRYSGQPPASGAGRYRDYIQWLSRQDAHVSEAFWNAQLADLQEPTRLARAFVAVQPVKGRGERFHVLDEVRTRQLNEFARGHKVTLNTLVQSAWMLLLQRFTGLDTVSFGATVSGRPAQLAGVEQQIGLFINTLPVIASPRAEQTLSAWLQQVQAQNLALREQEHTPLFEIQRWAGQGGEALFDNILVFENYPVSKALQQGAPQDLRFGEVANHEQTNYPLTLAVSLDDQLSLHLSFDREQFDGRSVEQLANQLDHLLLQMVQAQSSTCLGELALAAGPMLAAIDAPASEHYVHQWFERQVAQTPDAIALIFEDRQLTYAELNAAANRVAHGLLQHDVGCDVLVGIAVDRSMDMIISLLAVLKAGGAYVPLDPGYPADRLLAMIEDSGLRLMLSQQHLLQRLPSVAGVRTLTVDGDAWPLLDSNPTPVVHGQSLAYVMFTSGSTGRPKGVGISHATLARHTRVSEAYKGLSASDRVLQFATFNFDSFVEQVYPALICGAALVLRGNEVWDSETLYQQIIDRDISIADLTTAYWNVVVQDFADHGPRDYGRLRQMVVGGEAMPPQGIAAYQRAGLEQVQLINAYGPTEATVTSTVLDCVDYVQGGKPLPVALPIGHGLAGRTIHILDSAGQPVPQGVVGELLIGGELLARGYFQRPELTADRFLPDPFSTVGGRLYRTGDLARVNADGLIEYVGRLDHQVKVRGFRIELGEIETCLLHQDGVRQALVLAQPGAGGQQLVAYVVPHDESLASNADATWLQALRDGLKNRLPDYMQPSHVLLLTQLPIGPSGKLDRKALPLPDSQVSSEDFVAPQGQLEQQIAQVWQDVLEREQIGRNEHFFEAGGHSLLATQAVSRLRKVTGLTLSLRDLFGAPVLKELAVVMQANVGAELAAFDSRQVELKAHGTKSSAPLSLVQRRLWIAEQLSGGTSAYGMPMALRLRGDLSVRRLLASFAEVVRRHEVLRTAYVQDDEGDPIAVIVDEVELDFPLVDLSGLSRSDQEEQVAQAVLDNANTLIDMEQAPLLRGRILHLSASEHVLLYSMHHIISDGWSMGVLINELVEIYDRASAGEPHALPALAVQYSDFALWQQALEQQGVLGQQATFWKEQLAGYNGQLGLPLDNPRGATPSYAGDAVQFALGAQLSRDVRQLASRAGVTLYSTLLASFQVLLHRVSEGTDVLVGADVAGRERAELEHLIGFFVNVLPLRSRFASEASFRGFLTQTQDTLLQALEHQDLPFDMIVDASGVPRHKGMNPLVQVLFVMNNLPGRTQAMGGLNVEALPSLETHSKFDMALFVDEEEGQLLGNWQFATSLFGHERIQYLVKAWIALLEQIVADQDIQLGAISMPVDNLAAATRPAAPGPKADKLGKFLKRGAAPVAKVRSAPVRETLMAAPQPFPLLVEPNEPQLDLIEWIKNNRPLIESKLATHAGILFRGFELDGIQGFEAFAEAIQPGLYGQYGDLPKKEGGKNTYRSTPYPERKMILFHNESSHQDRWPRKQMFYCEVAAPIGGATPVVDCRLMYEKLPADLRDKFEEKGLLYVRTFTDKLDVSWQHFFKTEDRAEVEARCRAGGIEWRWLDNDELQTRTPAPAIIRHPVTGAKSFFNQVQLHHIYWLEPDVREDLLSMFGLERMPRHVYYGDGTPIEDEVMRRIGELYEACAVRFDWQKGDAILLDNMLVAHARDPFEGPRKIVVAMGDMFDHSDLQGASGEPVRATEGTEA